MAKDNGIVTIAFDPGRHTGFAIYLGEKLMRFGQITVNDTTDVAARVADILAGRTGYPEGGAPIRPALAIVEEGSDWYQESHRRRDGAGERALRRGMKVNTECRFRLERALLRAGIPHLSVKPETWGAANYTLADVLAELARAGIPEPKDFRIKGRGHQRDAIVLGGRMARRRVWDVR
ncbi:MAG: hypothetical protein PVH29_06155 [Candidatus Zixiibacteriota bacterium]|jgi:hypothetical protein